MPPSIGADWLYLLANASIMLDGMNGHHAGQVVCGQQPVPCRIRCDVDLACADRDGFAKWAQRAVCSIDPECGQVMLAVRLPHRHEIAGRDIKHELCRVPPGILDQGRRGDTALRLQRGVRDVGVPAGKLGSNGIVEDSGRSGTSGPGEGRRSCNTRKHRGRGTARQHVVPP